MIQSSQLERRHTSYSIWEIAMPIIKKTNISQQVFSFLQENIENGTWPVGSKIPSENELTKMMDVSRSSVRTAIQQCIALNILESQHGRGTFVKNNDVRGVVNTIHTLTQSDYNDILKVLEFRKVIESGSASLAAARISKTQLDKLQNILETMKKKSNEPNAFVQADMQFHLEISRASGNVLIKSALQSILGQTLRSSQQLNLLFGYKDGVYYHTKILNSMRNKDSNEAKMWMEEHMQHAMDQLPNIMSKKQ